MLYGLTVVSGIIIATWFVNSVTRGKPDAWDALSYVLIPGLIGARLYHVASAWSYYSANLIDIFKIWQGGLGIFGGILGGLLGLIIYSHLSHLRLLSLLDLAALATPLAGAIGRFGNFFNQELYGLPTNLPWGIYINGIKYHPLFLYESLGCLAIFFLLVLLVRLLPPKPDPATFSPPANYVVDGRLFFAYIALYGLLRFFLEPLRIETWQISNLDVVRVVSIVLIIAGLVGLVRNWQFRSLKLDKEVRN